MEPFEKFLEHHADWSRATFGPDRERGPLGPLDHLKKELKEVLEAPGDLLEYADMVMLIFDAIRRAGFSYSELLGACWYKLAVNKRRKWQMTTGDSAVEHIR